MRSASGLGRLWLAPSLRLRMLGFAVFGPALLRLVVGTRRVFVRRIGMLRGRTINVRIAPRLALRSSGGRSIWHRAHFSCLARIVRGCRVHPGRRVIAIHRVRRTIVPPDTPARRRRISGGAISATVISTLRWTIRAMLCFPFVARCHHIAMEITARAPPSFRARFRALEFRAVRR